jgi:hypothetical protein
VVVPGGRRLVDPVVDPHEVGVFSELGDDFSSVYTLSLACDRRDRHKALLKGSVYSALDRLESFRKVADCHTRFYRENRMLLICAPGSNYTHMIDKTRVIPLL